MLETLLLFLAVYILNIIPAFAPPAWIALPYAGFRYPYHRRQHDDAIRLVQDIRRNIVGNIQNLNHNLARVLMRLFSSVWADAGKRTKTITHINKKILFIGTLSLCIMHLPV